MELLSRAGSRRSGRYGELFFEALFLEEAGVVAIAGDEFVVSAELGDAASDEDCDLIGVASGGDPVRDEDRGSALHVLL